MKNDEKVIALAAYITFRVAEEFELDAENKEAFRDGLLDGFAEADPFSRSCVWSISRIRASWEPVSKLAISMAREMGMDADAFKTNAPKLLVGCA